MTWYKKQIKMAKIHSLVCGLGCTFWICNKWTAGLTAICIYKKCAKLVPEIIKHSSRRPNLINKKADSASTLTCTQKTFMGTSGFAIEYTLGLYHVFRCIHVCDQTP